MFAATMEGGEDTPWALVKRLEAAKAPLPELIAQLHARGLAADDVELLLNGYSALEAWPRRGPEHPAALVVQPADYVAEPGARPGLRRGFLGFGSQQLASVADFSEPNDVVFEHGDVQFTVKLPRGPRALGSSAFVKVVAQNCLDAPRSLLVQLIGDVGQLSSPERFEVPLPPGAIVEASLPVWVLVPTTQRVVTLLAWVASFGSAVGVRLRSSRGQAYKLSAPNALAENLVGLASLAVLGIGWVREAGEGLFSIRHDFKLPLNAEVPVATVRTRYEPTAEELRIVRGR